MFNETILQEIGKILHSRNETISVAESVTSGCLQLAFSQITEASTIYKGGITAYSIKQKIEILKVDATEAEVENCVSQSITEQMAENVAGLFNTTWAIATTGYATQVPESQDKQFAHCSIFHKGDLPVSKKIELLPNTNPKDAQQFYAEAILYELHALLLPDLK